MNKKKFFTKLHKVVAEQRVNSNLKYWNMYTEPRKYGWRCKLYGSKHNPKTMEALLQAAKSEFPNYTITIGKISSRSYALESIALYINTNNKF